MVTAFEQLNSILQDDVKYIESMMKIENKDRKLVPFKLNPVQRHFQDNMTTRDVICKAAQHGFTSFIMALFLKDCITIPGTTSVVVAHEEFITQRLLNKAKFFESMIPEPLKPKMHHKSSYELRWDDINSTFYIGSARSYIFGRGERIDNFLGSEIAFWADPLKIMIPTLQRVPLQGRVILESTPHGEGTYYHEQFKLAEAGKSRFKAHFYPWWLAAEYSLPPGHYAAMECDKVSPLPPSDNELIRQQEATLIATHGITEDQVRWRRMKIAEIGQQFFEEFPEDTETCFFTSTELVFDKEILDALARGSYPAQISHEGAQVWFPPDENGKYVVGVDPTVGVTNKAAATVWALHTPKLRHCATLTGMYDPVALAGKIKSLASYYNNASLVIEANNPGLTTISHCLEYPNLYYRRDFVTGKPTRHVGWLTTASTKPFAFSEFATALPNIETYDINLIREARNQRFVGMLTESIGDDDILMSAAIAVAARSTLPTVKKGYAGSWGWRTW